MLQEDQNYFIARRREHLESLDKAGVLCKKSGDIDDALAQWIEVALPAMTEIPQSQTRINVHASAPKPVVN